MRAFRADCPPSLIAARCAAPAGTARRGSNFVWDPHQQIAPYPCQAVVEIDRPQGTVPHHLPGANTFLGEFPAKYGIPPEAARGGAETMYPEFALKLKTMPSPGTMPK